MDWGPCLLQCYSVAPYHPRYRWGDCKGWVASGGGVGLVLARSEQQLVRRLGLGEGVETEAAKANA